jgi:hypothetical protein
MNYRTIGIAVIFAGGLVLYSQHSAAWILSAIFVGVGSGLFFFQKNKNDIDK